MFAETSPFPWNVALNRIARFLLAYDETGTAFRFSTVSCLRVTVERLLALADWTERQSLQSDNRALLQHASMIVAMPPGSTSGHWSYPRPQNDALCHGPSEHSSVGSGC